MRAAHKKLEITVLTDKQQAILEICAEGQTAANIAKYINIHRPAVYFELAKLQQMGLIAKCGGTKEKTFTTVGAGLANQDGDRIEYDPEKVNVEFIKHSHKIFARAA